MAEALMAPAAGVPGEECRINALPTDVLLRALSHLDALQVVQTCVLSRRWRDLWRSVPRISATHKAFKGTADTMEECDALFKTFVNRFLMLRNPIALHEFNLGYYVQDEDDASKDYRAESEDANLWIGHTLQCNARSIHVSVADVRLPLDSSLFTSNFLNSLELTSVVLFRGFFANLQIGCTVLEHLTLSECYIEDAEICSQTLKVFTIGSGCEFSFSERPTISIQSLVHFGYDLCIPIPLLLPNMESLQTASVSVNGTDVTLVDHIYQVLCRLSGVTNLDFHYIGKTLKMEKNVQWCPKFNNLTILSLGEWCLYENFYALIIFLQNSPNLVKLTLELPEVHASCVWIQKKDSTFLGDLEERSFTCKHLKIVEIICSEYSEDGPMFHSLEKLLTDNGITSGQTGIIHRTGPSSDFVCIKNRNQLPNKAFIGG